VKPVAFDYVAARSLEEALAALAEGGDDAKPIAGGQSLVPALNMRLVRPSLLVDLNRAGLDAIEDNGAVVVGATVRQAFAERDERMHPLVREALPHVGHVVTRNRGTIGGSVAHADGAAELPLCLATLAGTICVAGPAGRREVPPAEFFVTHYTTTLAPGELVVATHWPRRGSNEGWAFEELALRAGDYALTMVAVTIRRVEGVARAVRIGVGAVTDVPTILTQAAVALEGTTVSDTDVAAAASLARAAVDPPGTIHADPTYLRHATGVLVERAVRRAWERAA
jgi:carbon-monoxide dehydrogenase medium subunit